MAYVHIDFSLIYPSTKIQAHIVLRYYYIPMPQAYINMCILLTVGLAVIACCALILYFNIGLPNELRGFFFFVQVCKVQGTKQNCSKKIFVHSIICNGFMSTDYPLNLYGPPNASPSTPSSCFCCSIVFCFFLFLPVQINL